MGVRNAVTYEIINGNSPSTIFLSGEDLESLTGYKRPGDQRRWLDKHGWAFEVRADGKNRILTEEARTRMLTGNPRHRATEPNLDALRTLG